jgi:hypothetical protein
MTKDLIEMVEMRVLTGVVGVVELDQQNDVAGMTSKDDHDKLLEMEM